MNTRNHGWTRLLGIICCVSTALQISFTRIPYDDVVIPRFKQKHPQARVSQIFSIGGYGFESFLGKRTDIVIIFSENNRQALEEIWTVTRGDNWDVRFKCISRNNVCQ